MVNKNADGGRRRRGMRGEEREERNERKARGVLQLGFMLRGKRHIHHGMLGARQREFTSKSRN